MVSAIEGVDLSGERANGLELPVPRPTLLLFLSAGCGGCVDLFAATQPSAGTLASLDAEVLIVLRDASDPGLSELVGSASHVVAPQAWSAYRVDGAPFFSLLLPGLDVVGTEGVAWGAEAVAESVVRAMRGDLTVEVPRLEVD
jgi:hypothetical protein